MAKYNLFPDCRTNRLLPLDNAILVIKKISDIDITKTVKKITDPSFQKDVEDREKAMDLEDKRRRDGKAIWARI